MTAIEKGYVDAPSGQVHYRAAGSGPALLLLHQTATSGRMWMPVVERLADRFRCLALDTPGFGLSDAPPRPYLMEDYAAAVAAALTALGVARAHVLGHHTGASIAAQLAADFPERVDRLILHACPVGNDEFRRAKLAEATPVPLADDGSHVEWVRARILGYSTPLPPEELHWFILEYLTALPRYHEAHVAVWTQRVEELAPRIAAPTLLLTGDRDLFVEQQDALAARFPNARSVILPGGRLVMLEDPDRYAALVAGFLSESS
ncbi:MAG: alpha/beta hydrolase [Dehalococcoidia bacterium]|nr:alpha/beta hydrolase [Dehalococcoidia bacterium]